MSHEIETHQNADGSTVSAAVFAREPAWHRLGVTFDRDLTAADVLDEGHLGGWGVRRDDTPVLDNRGAPVDGFYAVSRSNPFTKIREPFGVVGGVWEPIQNEQTLELLDAIKGQTNGRFETAGSLRGGRAVFVTTKMSEDMLIGGVDALNRYLTMLNYHDGTGSLLLLDTPVRVVCGNTERAALVNHKSMVKVRHTSSATLAVAEIRRALGLTFKFDSAFEAEAEKMIQAPMSEAQFVQKTRLIWPVPKDESKPRSVNIHARREGELVKLFSDADTQANIRGTRWAGYNAVTEYLDWFTPVGPKRDANLVRATRSAEPRNRVGTVKELAFAQFAVK
jgi:phage/plasmid-like protein (TIGR03299 family)